MAVFRITLFILAFTTLFASVSFAQEIYVWKDKDGHMHMQNTKPPHLDNEPSRMERRERFIQQQEQQAEAPEDETAGQQQERQTEAQTPSMATETEPQQPAEQAPQQTQQPGAVSQPQTPTFPDSMQDQQWPPEALPGELEEQMRQQFQQDFSSIPPQQMLAVMAVPLLIALGMYLFLTFVFYRIGRKFNTGSFFGFLVPFYNIYLLLRCANLPGWYLLLFFLPIISFFATFLLWGKIAERLGKNFVLWGVLCAFLGLPILVLAFDSSRPVYYQPSPQDSAKAQNW